ncbi:hypothetical protein F511_38294 [Dorcoceras hygrometricum]|uniref:Uncharacterized protein n=1 Tax=Dorcoceras hygrometricum TaxID=472368 RepID=A0A2Z7D096_9LAMI|nr:hypothetical protein F511_38294 [Dorcoceras hygrometricum]
MYELVCYEARLLLLRAGFFCVDLRCKLDQLRCRLLDQLGHPLYSSLDIFSIAFSSSSFSSLPICYSAHLRARSLSVTSASSVGSRLICFRSSTSCELNKSTVADQKRAESDELNVIEKMSKME